MRNKKLKRTRPKKYAWKCKTHEVKGNLFFGWLTQWPRGRERDRRIGQKESTTEIIRYSDSALWEEPLIDLIKKIYVDNEKVESVINILKKKEKETFLKKYGWVSEMWFVS